MNTDRARRRQATTPPEAERWLGDEFAGHQNQVLEPSRQHRGPPVIGVNGVAVELVNSQEFPLAGFWLLRNTPIYLVLAILGFGFS